MAITIPEMPTFTDPTIGLPDQTMHTEAWAMVNAKYRDAGKLAGWAAKIMNSAFVELALKLGSDTVDDDLAAIQTEIGAILEFTPGTITGGNGTFSDELLTTLRARLQGDMNTRSTGLGAVAEAAMFGRETNRQNALRAQAYKENTRMYSSNGWDLPPGAMMAKQTEMSNQSTQQLSESSGKILEESARLALDYNKHVMSVTAQMIGLLSQVFDSQQARAFEASKASVMLSVENYKNTLALVSTKADIALKKGELVLATKARQLTLEVETTRAIAQEFQQMVASAMNATAASVSFGYGGSANTSYVGS